MIIDLRNPQTFYLDFHLQTLQGVHMKMIQIRLSNDRKREVSRWKNDRIFKHFAQNLNTIISLHRLTKSTNFYISMRGVIFEFPGFDFSVSETLDPQNSMLRKFQISNSVKFLSLYLGTSCSHDLN